MALSDPITTAESFDARRPEAEFQEGLERGELRIQKCGACGFRVFYPRLLCPKCGSARLESVVAAGRGRVYSTSVVRERPDAGSDYNISIVELVEGPRLLTRIVDVDPGKVRIGMAVDAFVGELDGHRVVLFRPSKREER